jgi:hypothetical protein
MTRSAVLLLCLGLGLTVGTSESRSAPLHGLSFSSQSGSTVVGPSNASVLVDEGSGRFVRVKAQGSQVAVADAIGDLNGDGKPDLVTHSNDDENDTCSESDGVEVCSAYVYVSLSRKNGTFHPPRIVYESDSADVAAAAVADVNRDGKRDLLIALEDNLNGAPGVLVMLGAGKGKFRRAQFVPTANPVAITAGDVNGDGRPDVVTAGSNGTVTVLLNHGGRLATSRAYRVGSRPTALVIGDLNGDRRPDLAVARSSGAVHAVTVLLNRGHGSFGSKRSYPTGNHPASVAIGDLNGDHRPDLATANTPVGTVSVLVNEGGGRFRAKLDYATASTPIAVAVGKFNSDRRRDLVVPTSYGELGKPVTVLVNTPGLCDVQDVWDVPEASAATTLAAAGCSVGTVSHAASHGFAAGRIVGQKPDAGAVLNGGSVDLTVSDGPGPGKIAAAPSFGTAHSYAIPKGGDRVAIGDVNGDGAADVVTVSCGHSVSVFLNTGHGALAARQDYTTAACPQTVALADLNGDGKPDIVVGGEEGTISVLMNQGDGTFGPKHDYVRGGEGDLADVNYVAVGDLNGDGKPDLATANGFESSGVSVLLNNGDGTFAARRDYHLAAGAESIGIGDFNGDGKLDLVTDEFGDLTVLLNDGGGEFHQAGVASAGGADYSYVFVGDLTADGYPDVVVVNEGSGAAQVLLDNVTGTLRPSVAYPASSNLTWVAIGDANRDGTQDLVTAGKSLSLLRNRGDGTFLAKRGYTMGTRAPRGVALGDLNGDGKPDLVAVNGVTVVVRLAR